MLSALQSVTEHGAIKKSRKHEMLQRTAIMKVKSESCYSREQSFKRL